MNDIRLNKEEEKTILYAQFKVPIIFYLPLIIFLIISIWVGVVFGKTPVVDAEKFEYMEVFDAGNFFKVFFLVFILTGGMYSIFFLIPSVLAIKNTTMRVTNKRVVGSNCFFFIKGAYAHRLDMINNISRTTVLGIECISFEITQGNRLPPKKLSVAFLANAYTVYSNLNQLLTSVKNDKDLETDIQMKKIEADNKKADALEHIAQSVIQNTQTPAIEPSISYLQELKELHELKENGIITQEEFEEKKKEVLKKQS